MLRKVIKLKKGKLLFQKKKTKTPKTDNKHFEFLPIIDDF